MKTAHRKFFIYFLMNPFFGLLPMASGVGHDGDDHYQDDGYYQDEGFYDDDISSTFSIDNYWIESGQASFSNLAGEVQVTASDGAIINYPSGFDIPAGETVRFIQPSTEASVINQITSQVPTQIDGNLLGNGKVVLMNASGIVFGKSSVVDVGKLHAIAGRQFYSSGFGEGFTQFTVGNVNELTGSVTASGSITAGEVVLAGTSVTHSGTILVDGGSLVMAAGAMMQLINQESGLAVTVSSSSPFGGATDLAGQALLQSGVVQASQAELMANSISHSGTTTATSLTLSEFSTFSGNEGTLSASTLSVIGSDALESAPDFSASGKNNQISQLVLSGFHDDYTLRSSTSMVEGTASLENPAGDQDFTTHSVQNLDLRLDNGDLTVNSLFAPVNTRTDNSLLLGAENNLVLASGLDSYTHARKILYGRNLSAGEFADSELALGSTVSLNAISVFMDDLSPTLSAEVIQKLALDNPSFEGFDSQGGLLELSALSSNQLEMLFEYGLFTGYSYFLQAPTAEAVLVNELEESGFTSTNAFFGGDFSIMASAGATGGGSSSSSSDSSDSSDGESEEESSASADSSPAGVAAAKAMQALGTAPFSPVGRPILSPEAALILEKALTPQIEAKLDQFLGQ